MITFNINQYIKVKLTDKGKEVIQNDYDRLCAAYPNADFKPVYLEDDEGYTKFQLWDFMRLFGEYMYCGSPCYIENNEIFFDTGE